MTEKNATKQLPEGEFPINSKVLTNINRNTTR